MKSCFHDKINPKTQENYIIGNITEAEAVFSISDKDLEEIAEKIIEELEKNFFFILESEGGKTKNNSEELCALALYRRDISRYVDGLDFSESITLARRSELGDQKARDQLICAYLGWAAKVANRFNSQRVELLDLIQQANLGLIDAVDRWEKAESKGATFVTYAAHRVTGEILDWLRGTGRPAGQPPHTVKELKKKIEWIAEHWRGDAPPTPAELAKLCGVSRQAVISAILFKEISLDDLAGETSSRTLSSEDNLEDSVLSYIEAKDCLKLVQRAIDKFSARHADKYREILLLRLGFTSDMKLKKIGERFGLTESRICQIMKDFFAYLEVISIKETTDSILAMQEIVASHEATI